MTLPALTLRNKLLVFAALIVLVPGVLIGVLVERSGRESLRRAIGERLAREAHHTAGRLSGVLRAEREALASFARQDVMREVRVGDIDLRISRALGALRDVSDVRVDYLVVDGEERVVAASAPERIQTPPSWARHADAGPTALAEGLVLSTPVHDPDTPGATLGRLVGLLDWRILATVTERVRRDLEARGISSRVVVVSGDGRVMGGVEPSAGASRAWSAIAPGAPPGGDYVVSAQAGSIVGRAPLDAALPGATVLVAEDTAHALAPARALRNRIAVLVALALAAALVIAAVAARRVTQPLADLTQAIEGLSRGDPAVLRVPARTRDEVGSLASAFNRMASELDRVQRDLVEAEKFAFVGELASGVAHEVRTSLGVLRSSAQILQRSISSDAGGDTAELAEMIRAEADRLGGVVDDLLSLDRPRRLHPESQPVSRSVLRAADFVEPQAAEKHIRVHCRTVEDEPDVLCDAEAIHQVAVNLLVNGIEALPDGGSIEVEVLPARNGYGGFVVRDDGAGVPEALRERIFRPFVTARDGGVGLGLTFVKRVVHEHQGRIFLEPTAGGACFRVELPVATGPAEPREPGGAA